MKVYVVIQVYMFGGANKIIGVYKKRRKALRVANVSTMRVMEEHEVIK
jgi:hypothetical protein